MKRILITAIAITCAVACCPKKNNGAGYNTVTPAVVHDLLCACGGGVR